MIRLKVNGTQVEVAAGASLLEAAQQAGAEIPTLCYEKETGALTSCMICVVKDKAGGRTFPACSAKAIDGMDIDTDGEELRAARREILTMLLSEHVGDCEAPCSRICPASLNVPRMLRYIVGGDMDSAARIAQRDLIFPATLGRLCTAPCETGCRRSSFDSPISIRKLHGAAAEQSIKRGGARDERAQATGKTIAIVGAGLAGLSAAWTCLQSGHACRVYEKRANACFALRSLPPEQLPPEILDAEIERVRDLGAEFAFECEIGSDVTIESLLSKFDAVIAACDISHPPHTKIFSTQEDAMLVRSVANGKAAARRAGAFLSGLPGDGTAVRFNSQIGRLGPEELASYAKERLHSAESQPEDTAEAARCLHCDCLKPVSCKLRRYAEEYGVGPHVKRHMKRPPVDPIQRFDNVLLEPGKCVKCGICVEITRAAGVVPGLAFVGRGLASRVQVPFGKPLAFGLGEVALQCVRACPTGALALRNEEETA